MRRLLTVSAAFTIFAPTTLLAHGVDADIRARVESGKIVTDAFIDAFATDGDPLTEPILPGERVFAYELEPAGGLGFQVGDPGIRTLSNATNGFPSPSNQIGFNVVTPLMFWNGADPLDVGFSPAAPGASFKLELGLNETTPITGTSGLISGFNVADANDGHEHLTSILLDGSAPAGIYYFGIELTTNAPGIASSDPVYLVYNSGGEDFEDAHIAAIEYVEESVIPEPASLGLLGLGSLFLRRRR